MLSEFESNAPQLNTPSLFRAPRIADLADGDG
jgi:hypothetical protein